MQATATELSILRDKLDLEILHHKQMKHQLEQRSKLLSTLLNVSNLVSSTLEIKPLFESILDLLKTIIDYQGAKIFVIDGDYVKLVAHRSMLTQSEEAGYILTYRQLTIGVDIIVGKKPVIIDDILDDTQPAEVFRDTLKSYLKTALRNVRSWMGIPLIIKDNVVGVLTLDHSEPGFFTLQHTEQGMAFANQAAVEYENVRLFHEANKKADELKTMFSIQQAITSRLDLDSVLKLIADEARRLTQALSTAVLLVEGDDLVISAFSGEDPMQVLGVHVPIKSSLLGRHLMTGKSVVFKNKLENPEAQKDIIKGAGEKAYLIVPLMAENKPVGIISATNKITDEFSQEDERILNMFASSVIIGIENARMYKEEQYLHERDRKRRVVAEGLRDILAVLNSNRPLDEILDFIICEAARLMGTDSGSLYQLQKEQNTLKLMAACGLPDEFLSKTVVPIGSGAIGQTVLQRKPVVLENILEAYEQSKNTQGLSVQLAWLNQHCNGLLAVPLISKNEVYGGIVLYFKKTKENPSGIRQFSKEQIDLAMAFADQAALAIDNAQLRAKTEKMAVTAERNRLARDLHDAVTQTLFSASLLAEVLPKIWGRNPEEGYKRLEELRQLSRGALAEMRTLLLELRPATLVEASLEELFKQLSEATIGRARIPVTLQLEDGKNIPTDVKIALYRIAQEALNNVSKHSDASEATVTLTNVCGEENEERCIELIIRDNGRGFDPKLNTGDHLGLGIMQERSEAIQGEFVVESSPGEGTLVVVRWRGRM